MIGHAALRKVVRPDLRRTIARANLRLAHARPLRLLLRNAHVEQARSQDFHRLRLVLNLRTLVLLFDFDPRRQVGDPTDGIRTEERIYGTPWVTWCTDDSV